MLIALLAGYNLYATNYYVSPNGSDSNSGTSPTMAWKTIDKVNASMSTITAGDIISFQSGGVYVGTLNINSKNGTESAYITINSYGTGEKPIISASQGGLVWTKVSNTIWKADLPALKISNVSVRTPSLFIDNIPQQIGREPNASVTNGGYRTINNHASNNSQITESANLPYAQNQFAGAEIVIRTNRDFFNHETIISHSGNALNITTTQKDAFIQTIRNKFGYIIQNHLNTLDIDGEWAHDIEKGLLYIYSAADPNTRKIEVPKFSHAINISNSSFIKISNIRAENSSVNTLGGQNWKSVIIDGCEILNSAEFGSNVWTATNCQFINSTIENVNNTGFRWEGCSNVVFKNNIMKNVGMRAGMGGSSFIPHTGLRLINSNTGETSTIENNIITQIGYHGLNTGNNVLVRQNDVSHFCKVKDDGGGIYMAGNLKAMTIAQNFVHDAPGAFDGAPAGDEPKTAGIYVDNNSINKSILNNTVYNIGAWGIMANLSGNNIIKSNLTYNCGTGLILNTYANTFGTNGSTALSENNTAINNILVAGNIKQYCARFNNSVNPSTIGSNLGILDSNYYLQPFAQGLQIRVEGNAKEDLTFTQFKAKYPNYEANGKNGPSSIEPGKEIRFETNFSNTEKSLSLGSSNYVDVKGNTYSENVKIPPYGSMILFLQTKPLVLGTEIVENQIKVYPNPSSEYVTVTNLQVGDQIIIANSVGSILETLSVKNSTETISLKGFSSGVYYIPVSGKGLKRMVVE